MSRTTGEAPREDRAGLYRVCKEGLRPASTHPVEATVGSQAERHPLAPISLENREPNSTFIVKGKE